MHLHLWACTSDRTHLAAAKQLLDDSLADVPAEHHEATCTNITLHREILAAWQEEFGVDGAPGASPSGRCPPP